MVKYLNIALLFLIFVFTVHAQNNEQSIYVYGIGAMPISDFGDNIGNKVEKTRRNGFDYGEFTGLAKLGYGIG